MFDKTLILPWGLSFEEYSGLLNSQIDGTLVTKILVQLSPRESVLFRQGDKCEIIEALEPVVDILQDSPMPTGIGRVMIDYAVVPGSRGFSSLFGPAQKKWLVDGRYVQVGFSSGDIVLDADIDAYIANGLILYDFLVERHGSIDPRDHEEVELPYNQVRQMLINMNDVYRHKLTALPRELLEFRNKVAVMARAALAGDDPVVAYQTFLEQSHGYFLGTPFVQFTHPKDFYTIDGLVMAADAEARGVGSDGITFVQYSSLNDGRPATDANEQPETDMNMK